MKVAEEYVKAFGSIAKKVRLHKVALYSLHIFYMTSFFCGFLYDVIINTATVMKKN
jgi:hypothetical protein